MKNLTVKDKTNRFIVQSFELEKFVFRSLVNNKTIPVITRFKVFEKSLVLSKKTSKSFIINRCSDTNRKKRINKLFHFSRIRFRYLAQKGYLSGIKKSVW